MIKQNITTWSYSRYSTYSLCPHKARRQFIDIAPSITNDAMQRGQRIHLAGESWMKNPKHVVLPTEYEHFKKEMHKLKKAGAIAEDQWTFTNKFNVTGWFDEDAWLRMKLDVHLVQEVSMKVIDYKTGQLKDDYFEQLDLYGLGAFLMYEGLENVVAEIWYLDAKVKVQETYSLKDYPRLKKEWLEKTKPLLSDTKFLPSPNYLCKWCQFRRNGGDGSCRF